MRRLRPRMYGDFSEAKGDDSSMESIGIGEQGADRRYVVVVAIVDVVDAVDAVGGVGCVGGEQQDVDDALMEFRGGLA